ncbi:hypothetical protein KKD03_00265 [Patescibacteria group bacterium]|nr:hypothetical protein [Patescibacteria group bacterium]
MKSANKVFFTILLILTFIFVLFRISFLETVPNGFYVDESSIAYNAYSILKTGADEHGVSFPLYFKAFGDYKNPIYIYSQVILFAILGSTRLVARLTSALWGLGTILVFYLFVRSQNKSKKLIFSLCLIFLTSPWHIQLSRTVFEIISYPFFLMVATYLVWSVESASLQFQHNKILSFLEKIVGKNKLVKRKLSLLLYSLAIVLGLSFYTYTAARMLSPLLFVGFLLIYKKYFTLKEKIVGITLFSLCLLPVVIWELQNPGSMMSRYSVVGLSRYSADAYDFIKSFISGYFSHFHLNFLFISGDGNLRHSSGWHSNFLWSTIPMLGVGIHQIFFKKTNFFKWIFLGVILSPILSALTIETPHTLRSIGLMFFLIIVASIGLEKIFHYSQKNRLKLFNILVTLLVVESLFFLHDYLGNYKLKSGAWHEADAYESIGKIFQYEGPFFFSNDLYEGTYATVSFIQKDIIDKQSLKMNFINFKNFGQQGTYLLEKNDCYLVSKQLMLFQKLNNLKMVWKNGSSCILTNTIKLML